MAFDQGSPSGDNSISQINVTPLVDVMLVLLVIFMVTAPILQQGVAVDVPKVAAGPLTGEEEQLVFNVAKGGKLYLNDTAMTSGDLATKLAAIAGSRPDRQVYVRADRSVPHGEGMGGSGTNPERRPARVG